MNDELVRANLFLLNLFSAEVGSLDSTSILVSIWEEVVAGCANDDAWLLIGDTTALWARDPSELVSMASSFSWQSHRIWIGANFSFYLVRTSIQFGTCYSIWHTLIIIFISFSSKQCKSKTKEKNLRGRGPCVGSTWQAEVIIKIGRSSDNGGTTRKWHPNQWIFNYTVCTQKSVFWGVKQIDSLRL